MPTEKVVTGWRLNAPSGKKADRLPVRAAEHSAILPGGDGTQVSETCTVITTLLDHEAAPHGQVWDAYLTRWSASETTFGRGQDDDHRGGEPPRSAASTPPPAIPTREPETDIRERTEHENDNISGGTKHLKSVALGLAPARGHPGPSLVITALTMLLAVQRALKPPGEAVAASRRSLSEVGKMSSASVLHILEMISDAGWPPAGSLGLRIGLGPGVSAEACPTEVVTL